MTLHTFNGRGGLSIAVKSTKPHLMSMDINLEAEATPLPADCAPPENEPAVIQQQPVADTPPKSEPAVIQQQPVAGGAQETLPYPPLASQTQPQPAGLAQPVPGQPPAYQPGVVGQPPPPALGYPQPGIPGQPPPPAPGYPQPGIPGQPPPPPGYQPGLGVGPNYPLAGQLAQNLPQQQVVWMPAPLAIPPSCPPGLEYLSQIDQVLVHQQIELLELITNYETENKYRIRNSLGQQIYFANEQSSVFQRQCCGPGRSFSMSITDNSQREVIHLERPLRCYYNCSGLVCYCCCSCCLPHTIEVQAPPGTVVGYVKQDSLGILNPWFSIQNADGETVLQIKGPTLGCSCYSDANFLVLGTDSVTEVGKICKQWSGLAKEYFTDADNFGIQFPMDLDVKMKAVMLGACFLIDFMFFESSGGNAAAGRHRHQYHHR